MKDPTINDRKLDEIIRQCKNRMDVSYYKYGAARDNFASGRVDAVGSLELCLDKYKATTTRSIFWTLSTTPYTG